MRVTQWYHDQLHSSHIASFPDPPSTLSPYHLQHEKCEDSWYSSSPLVSRPKNNSSTSNVIEWRPGNEGPGNEGPGNEGPGNEGPGNEGPGNEGPGNGRPGNEGPGNEGPGNEGAAARERGARERGARERG